MREDTAPRSPARPIVSGRTLDLLNLVPIRQAVPESVHDDARAASGSAATPLRPAEQFPPPLFDRHYSPRHGNVLRRRAALPSLLFRHRIRRNAAYRYG